MVSEPTRSRKKEKKQSICRYWRLELLERMEFPSSTILMPHNYFKWKPKVLLQLRSRELYQIAMETNIKPNYAIEKSLHGRGLQYPMLINFYKIIASCSSMHKSKSSLEHFGETLRKEGWDARSHPWKWSQLIRFKPFRKHSIFLHKVQSLVTLVERMWNR